MNLLLIGIAIQILTGFGALLSSRRPSAATALGAGGAALGCLLGLVPAVHILMGAPPEIFRAEWDVSHGPFSVEIDALMTVGAVAIAALPPLNGFVSKWLIYPTRSDFGSRSPDPLLESAYEPFFRRCGEWFSHLRILQQGKTHVYLLYIVVMVVLTLTWASVRTGWVTP